MTCNQMDDKLKLFFVTICCLHLVMKINKILIYYKFMHFFNYQNTVIMHEIRKLNNHMSYVDYSILI